MSADTTHEEDTSLDDLMKSIGLNNDPITPEDLFVSENLTTLKIDLIRYWLRSEMSRYHQMIDNGVVPCKRYLTAAKIPSFTPVTALEYGEIAISYYLDMQHLGWFQDTSSRKALDKPAMVKRIVAIESVKKVIETAS